jgi:hypothetical protein
MTHVPIDPPDPSRLRLLARALRVSPRQLFVAAARAAAGDERTATERNRAISQARVPGAKARDAAALLMTPPTHFAQDELAPAIASVFPVPPTAGD